MHRAVCDNLQPDLTLLLLPSLEISLRRARRRNQRSVQQQGVDENRFERENDDFYTRIYRAYEAIAEREPTRVVPVKDDASIEAIQECIREVVSSRLPAPVE
jgi:dTMP kinase